MKKTFKWILLVAIMVLCVGSFTACISSSVRPRKHNHVYGESIEILPATCTTEGVIERNCIIAYCGFIEKTSVEIISDAHNWYKFVEHIKEATCAAEGETVFICKHNDAHRKSEVIEIDNGAHDWNTGVVTKKATCVTAGEKTFTCENDATHTKTEGLAIDENAHEYEGVETIRATCKTEGVKMFTCKHDSTHTKTEIIAIDNAAHDYDDGEILIEPTCIKNGLKSYTCKNDGCVIAKTETISAKNGAHDWDDWVVIKKATCVSEGLKSSTCKRDGKHVKTEVVAIAKDEHDYKLVVTKEPTETVNGEGYEQCLRNSNHIGLTRIIDATGTKGLEYKLINDGKEYEVSKGSANTDGAIVIARSYNDKPVTSIAESAFYGCKKLTSIKIPDSIIDIGYRAFDDCWSLIVYTDAKNVPISWMSNFPAYTAVYCGVNDTNLKEVDGIQYLLRDTSAILTKYTGTSSEFVIPNKLTVDGKTYDVTSIGQYAFDDCINLTSITLPESVTDFGYYAFAGCKNLETIVISEKVSVISQGAFVGCSSLTSIIIPDSVTEIQHYAFSGCSGLTSVTIPSSVKSIPPDVFTGCTKIKDIYFKGTREQWNKIYYDGIGIPSEATIHFNV